MRLAIFWPAQVYFDGARYTTHGFAHLWFGPLAGHFSGVDLIVPVMTTQMRSGPVALDTEHFRVLPLPSASRGWQLYTTHLPIVLLAMLRLIWTDRRHWDRVLIYEVQPLSQVWFWLGRLARLPITLYLGGRHDKAVLGRNSERGLLLRGFARVWARWCQLIVPRMTRRVPTVVTGSDLRDFYRRSANENIYSVASSSVSKADIIESLDERTHHIDDGDCPLVLAVCRVTPVKGLEYLIAALGQLASNGRRVRLKVAGRRDGAYEGSLWRLAESYGITDDIEFLGPITPGPSLRDLYDQAELFVLPSLSEGTPKVILEAMSRGVPVVASNVGGIPDLIEHGRTGLLVSAGRSDELAGAIEQLLSDGDLRQRLASEALVTVGAMTVEVQTARLAEIVKAGGGPGNPGTTAKTTQSAAEGSDLKPQDERRLNDDRDFTCTRVCVLSVGRSSFSHFLYAKEAASLVRAGHDVVIIAPCLEHEDPNDPHINYLGVQVIQLMRMGWGARRQKLATLPRLFTQAYRQRCETYQAMEPQSLLVGALVKVLTRRRLVYDSREHYPLALAVNTGVGPLATRILYGFFWLFEAALIFLFVDHVFAVDQGCLERFRRFRRPTSLLTNYPMRDFALQSEVGHDDSTATPDSFHFLFTGYTRRRIAVLETITAVAIMQDSGVQAHATFLGMVDDRSFLEQCHELAEDLGVGHAVELVGRVSHGDVARYLQSADCGSLLYLPTPYTEYVTHPVKLFEYMAYGLPVVCSDLPNMGRLVRGEECGLVVDASHR